MAFVAPHGAFATSPAAQGTLIVSKRPHITKAFGLMFLGFPLNVRVVRLVQLSNALFSISVTLDGQLVRASVGQLLNAYIPIEVIPGGKLLRARFEQLRNV